LCKYFPMLTERAVTPDDIVAYSRERCADKKPYKIYETVAGAEAQIQLNYRLMQLQDVDISTAAKMEIMDGVNATASYFDRKEFYRLFTEDKLYSVIPDVDRWLRDTFNRLTYYATNIR
jgi:hypothetical protein